MKRFTIILSAVIVAIFSLLAQEAGGLLWRVSGNGLKTDSYLFGSHHIAPATMIDSIAGLRQAVEEVEVVCGEVTRDELSSGATMQKAMIASMAPADSTLDRLLDERQLGRVDSVLTLCVGMPGAAAALVKMKPAAISNMITLLLTSCDFPEFNPSSPFDAAVMALGEDAGKQIVGLETVDSQMDLLYGRPIAEQRDELVKMLDEIDRLGDYNRRLVEAYSSQDLDAIFQLISGPDAGWSGDEEQRLLTDRNQRWAHELDGMMQSQPTLVVVGCAHLPGEQGLIALLRSMGYTVEPVSGR